MTASRLPDRGRVLALDVGDRRIGVAVCDPLRLIATPLSVIHRAGLERDREAVRLCALQQEAVAVVVGLPLLPSGDRGEQAIKVETFVDEVVSQLGLPVVTWDESYTTLEAERLRRERPGRSSGRRSRIGIDADAAAVILEEWLRAVDSPQPSCSSPPARDEAP